MWYTQTEQNIITHSRDGEFDKLEAIRKVLYQKHRFILYATNRFMEEYGDKLETDKAVENMFKHLSDEYSEIERLFRIMDFYETR